MIGLKLALMLLLALQALTLVGCGKSPEPPARRETADPQPPQVIKKPFVEPEVRTAVESEIESVTYVAHYMAPMMYSGPKGTFGAHQVTVVSSSPQVADQQLLRALLALDRAYADTSAIDLIVVFPAEDGTGLVRGYEWPRPLNWIKQLKGTCRVPSAEALEEIGLSATARDIDRATIQAAVDGTAEIPWDTKPN